MTAVACPPCRWQVELLTWDLEPGDCILHQSFAVHGAPGVTSTTLRRRAYATRWVGDEVVYDPRPGGKSGPLSMTTCVFRVLFRFAAS